jgi:phosphoribosyl-ATP pyrophosphohydrolase/phosphoribosyl-AMP cyclohydrolase
MSDSVSEQSDALDQLRFDASGLIPVIAQDHLTGQVRMLAYMNREALELTLATGLATFYSRSRAALWTKGESSGHVLSVHAVFADCDGDTLLLHVTPRGPSCHTGRPACFFREVRGGGALEEAPSEATSFLEQLEQVLESRKGASAAKSYTKSLFEAGAQKIGDKLREEASELAAAVQSESDERVLAEAADVLYHTLVGISWRGLSLRQVMEVLYGRTRQSGHQEKASRTAQP